MALPRHAGDDGNSHQLCRNTGKRAHVRFKVHSRLQMRGKLFTHLLFPTQPGQLRACHLLTTITFPARSPDRNPTPQIPAPCGRSDPPHRPNPHSRANQHCRRSRTPRHPHVIQKAPTQYPQHPHLVRRRQHQTMAPTVTRRHCLRNHSLFQSSMHPQRRTHHPPSLRLPTPRRCEQNPVRYTYNLQGWWPYLAVLPGSR